MPKPFNVAADAASVQAWSSFRLPFEPKGDALRLRSELVAALAALIPVRNEIFSCTYRSDVESFVDTENVLIYNVGPSSFTTHSQRGLRFERVFAAPPPAPVPLSAPVRHHVMYRATDTDDFFHWVRGAPIARWDDVRWPSKSSTPPVAAIWFALRNSGPQVLGRLDARTARFGIRIELATDALDLASAMKPMLDAVISAFHVHDRPLVLREAAERIAASGIGADRAGLERLLTDGHFNLLGARDVVSPRGATGVRWNPEDERCVAVQIVRSTEQSGDIRFSGELFAVSPV